MFSLVHTNEMLQCVYTASLDNAEIDWIKQLSTYSQAARDTFVFRVQNGVFQYGPDSSNMIHTR